MFQPRSRRIAASKHLALVLALSLGGGCSALTTWPDSALIGGGGDAGVSLAKAEQMIDALDRTLTTRGTIGVKSPDVWGQDRLAKFRSEYETQMAQWLEGSFKGVINASVKRQEAQALGIQLAAGLADPEAKTADLNQESKSLMASFASPGGAATAPAAAAAQAAPTPADQVGAAGMLEPTVVLDEHSQYLNHLSQLRRVNAGDDLTDRPGYGLYLVRIPVTLSPGPKSRRGRGAIITVSAKPLMTKETMRYALRTAVVNEAVDSLSQSLDTAPDESGEPTTAMGAGSFTLISYADTEIFQGPKNLAFLREEAERRLVHELNNEPHHRSTRISEWLRGELEAAYPMMEQEATTAPIASSDPAAAAVDPLEAMGDLIARRDFAALAAARDGSRDPGVMLASGDSAPSPEGDLADNRRRTLKILGFTLRVQAAALNARLKQDIADQLPGLSAEELRRVNFFNPDASDEAFRLFERYVQAKWPLRVYAIEPVIAQQNIADSMGRRSASALNLVAGGPIGPLLGAGNLSADRRVIEDEAAIRLNPTMVGFGAGESTFGWVFYPRLQTSREPYRNFASAALQLLCGSLPGGKDQSIEPGQRECTALIVMPNFVPQMEFVTVANWFRTGDSNDSRGSNIEMASDLAGRLIEAEEAVNRVRSAGRYRPEELQIAIERLNQLKSLMPTQRLVVRVPFASDHNDARIFCSRGGHLRPSLVAWHGKPPEAGEESTIFIEGNNFSVHDTHVIAGGKPAESVLISRNLMQVTIAKEAQPTPNANGVPLLDISVATPNGPSNHLLIRMGTAQPASPKSDGGPPPAPQPVATVGPPKPKSAPPDLDPPNPQTDPQVIQAADAKLEGTEPAPR